MKAEGRGPGGKVGPPPCAQGHWAGPEATQPPEPPPAPAEDPGAPEAPAPKVWLCDLCGAPMIDRHCKLSCPRCGYQRDCSDP